MSKIKALGKKGNAELELRVRTGVDGARGEYCTIDPVENIWAAEARIREI